MALYVHIADERDEAAIRRAGLRLPRSRRAEQEIGNRKLGVFALPVIANFAVSHQWVRELKKRGFRTAVGVYFRVPDNALVWAGAYNEEKRGMTAAEAAAKLRRTLTLGFEVIIPQSVPAADITGIRALPQMVGWRHFPEAHRRGIFCGCASCQRGEIKARNIRTRYEAGTL